MADSVDDSGAPEGPRQSKDSSARIKTPLVPAPEDNVPTPKRRWFSRLIDAALWVFVAFALYTVFTREEGGPTKGAASGSFELPLVGEEGTVKIPGELKRPLLIKAFASWCGACRRAAWFDQMEDERSEGKLDMIAVSVDDTAEAALSAKNSWSLTMPVAHDAKGELGSKYNVRLLPTYILIGTDGKIARVTSGMPTPIDFRAWKNTASGE